MNHKIKQHFRMVDPVLYRVIETIGEIEDVVPRDFSDYFKALCNEIITQQLLGRVADVIFGRFEKLFDGKKITPENILNLKHEDLRSTGMSNSKARYIMDLAQKIQTQEVDLHALTSLENEEVIINLTKVKGIGRWTAEMFLMFTLGREDIFSLGDLGLRTAVSKLYKVDREDVKRIEEISLRWKPYRAYACRILWRSLENK